MSDNTLCDSTLRLKQLGFQWTLNFHTSFFGQYTQFHIQARGSEAVMSNLWLLMFFFWQVFMITRWGNGLGCWFLLSATFGVLAEVQHGGDLASTWPKQHDVMCFCNVTLNKINWCNTKVLFLTCPPNKQWCPQQWTKVASKIRH